MRFRKMAAGVIAAAMAFASLPQVVSAESSDPVYGVGDEFWVTFDPDTGAVVDGKMHPDYGACTQEYNAAYACRILNDRTIAVITACMGNHYINQGKRITIPDTIAGYTVTQLGGIGKNAVSNDDYFMGGFASITVPDTVTTIAEGAFSAHNVLLEEINFGTNSQLKLIDQWAFQDCRSLKTITIPSSVETIAYGAFMNSDNPNTYIGDFTNTYSLKAVKFAEGSKLKAMGDYVFENQKALTSVELPEGVKIISKGAFLNCEALKTITIPVSIDRKSVV